MVVAGGAGEAGGGAAEAGQPHGLKTIWCSTETGAEVEPALHGAQDPQEAGPRDHAGARPQP